MEVHEMPLVAAVLGDPIGHSLSPVLHGHWLHHLDIKGHYVPLRVGKADFPAALESLQRLGFVGANVTVPNKEKALHLADHVSDVARRIGAANMLTFTLQGIEAENTDAFGFTWNIVSAVPKWQPRRAAVLGAGGASRAVITALLDLGAQEIRVANRNLERADHLAAQFGERLRVINWADRHEMLESCDTLVNATSLGMTGSEPLALHIDRLPQDALVTDLVYAPLETDLLASARKRGNPVVDGLGMLLHQAVPAFERWFGTRPQVDTKLRRKVMSHL